MTRRVLIVGASGTFGARLVALLAGDARLTLILAGRRRAALEAVARLHPGARIEVATLDRDAPGDLSVFNAWAVVDCAGPFQNGDWRLARAALEAGAHYADIADAREAVAGFPETMGEAALAAGRAAVTGASSTPALSCAAADRLVEGWRQVDTLTTLISPGARAPRGAAVLASILSWVGRPIRLFRDGVWTSAPGWSGTRRFSMPGLGRRWGSLCDTPDLDQLAARYAPRRDALFLAGLEQSVQHLGLLALSLLVRIGAMRSLAPLAPLLGRAADLLAPLGSDRGGMIVEARGIDAGGAPAHARWALWAEANAGPSTPVAPLAALVTRWLDEEPQPGARICVGLLWLDDITAQLAALPIRTRIDRAAPGDPVLFRRLLGPDYDALPESLRVVHGAPGRRAGRASARIGRTFAARLNRLALGLPASGLHPVRVAIEADGPGERWSRMIGPSRFVSTFRDGEAPGEFEERIGPIRFVFTLESTRNGLVWRLARWRMGPLPLPRFLAPQVRAGARDVDGVYRFDVLVAHRMTGLLFAYRGRLIPESLQTA